MRGARAIQHADELFELVRGQRLERGPVRVFNDIIQGGESFAAGVGELTVDDAAIIGAADPPHELFPLEPVDEAGHAGRPFDHARPDLQRRQSVATRTPQNPEHIELLKRDAVRRQLFLEVRTYDFGCAQERYDRFLAQ